MCNRSRCRRLPVCNCYEIILKHKLRTLKGQAQVTEKHYGCSLTLRQRTKRAHLLSFRAQTQDRNTSQTLTHRVWRMAALEMSTACKQDDDNTGLLPAGRPVSLHRVCQWLVRLRSHCSSSHSIRRFGGFLCSHFLNLYGHWPRGEDLALNY